MSFHLVQTLVLTWPLVCIGPGHPADAGDREKQTACTFVQQDEDIPMASEYVIQHFPTLNTVQKTIYPENMWPWWRSCRETWQP